MGGKRRNVIPKALSQKTMKRLLESHGWVETRGGKHAVKMEMTGRRPITLPWHKGENYGRGLRASILREAGLAQPGGAGEGHVKDDEPGTDDVSSGE